MQAVLRVWRGREKPHVLISCLLGGGTFIGFSSEVRTCRGVKRRGGGNEKLNRSRVSQWENQEKEKRVKTRMIVREKRKRRKCSNWELEGQWVDQRPRDRGANKWEMNERTKEVWKDSENNDMAYSWEITAKNYSLVQLHIKHRNSRSNFYRWRNISLASRIQCHIRTFEKCHSLELLLLHLTLLMWINLHLLYRFCLLLRWWYMSATIFSYTCFSVL